jgi:hypothetical protein
MLTLTRRGEGGRDQGPSGPLNHPPTSVGVELGNMDDGWRTGSSWTRTGACKDGEQLQPESICGAGWVQ